MTDTKLGKAFSEFRETHITAINWIIGLAIGEVGLILGLKFVGIKWLILILFLITAIDIFIAIIIIYVLVAQSSLELFSAILAKQSDIDDKSFKEKYDKKQGKLLIFLTDLVIDFDLYKWLFSLFLFENIIVFSILIVNII
jgi:hypothetical protein